MTLRLTALFGVILFLGACDRTPSPIVETSDGFLVASQGQFGADDGGVQHFNWEGELTASYGGLYVQSLAQFDDEIYVTSLGRVDVLDPSNLQRTRQYAGVANPRYLTRSGNSLLVTNLYTNSTTFGDGGVTRLSVSGNTADAPVIIGGNPEGITTAAGRVFVANSNWGSGTTVTVLDAVSLAEVDRVDVGCDGPRFVFTIRQTDVAIFCTGNAFGTPATNGAVVVLNAQTLATRARIDFPTTLGTASSGQMAYYSETVEEAYAIDGASRSIYRINMQSYTLAATIDAGGAPPHAVAYDPERQWLVLGRINATDPFTAQGSVTIHGRDGALLQTVAAAGVIPSHIILRTR